MAGIKENLADIYFRIGRAAEKSGRKLSDIILVAVTKTVEAGAIQQAVDFGITDVGENRVQELIRKQPMVGKPGAPHWHLIGHLQTNKVKQVVGKTCLIHSVDSLRLAQAIDKAAGEQGLLMPVLIEVNIAGEQSKDGVSPGEIKDFLASLRDLSNINVKGFMTVAPFVEKQEENRFYFAKMRNLLVDNNRKTVNNRVMTLLSMGMTNDFETAIEEGASIVRIGTGIFGERLSST